MLRKWRAEGLSHEKIARKLETEHAIDVTARTVAKWVAAGGENGSKEKAS